MCTLWFRRGLKGSPVPDCQAFELFLPLPFRTRYDKVGEVASSNPNTLSLIPLHHPGARSWMAEAARS
jgi:hypothetical protein